MADADTADEPDLPAGSFSAWLDGLRRVLAARREDDGADAGSAVPCDGCTACCTASQFVHIGPEERDTLAHIPRRLLFPAPRMPAGHVVLGYDEHGHCPMLVDGGCSIYEHRPRTCRTYDCRVFPAAGLEPDTPQVGVARRARRWRFEHPTAEDERAHEAVRAAARFVLEHEVLGGAANPMQVAVAAVEVSDAFLGPEAPPVDEVRALLAGPHLDRS